MYRSRLTFVEGIMGSGKPTTARWLARLFRRAGIPARPVAEARPHSTNVFRTLPHLKQPYPQLRQLAGFCDACSSPLLGRPRGGYPETLAEEEIVIPLLPTLTCTPRHLGRGRHVQGLTGTRRSAGKLRPASLSVR